MNSLLFNLNEELCLDVEVSGLKWHAILNYDPKTMTISVIDVSRALYH